MYAAALHHTCMGQDAQSSRNTSIIALIKCVWGVGGVSRAQPCFGELSPHSDVGGRGSALLGSEAAKLNAEFS